MANKNEGTEVVEKVVMRPLADLVRNPKNPRKSDPEGLKDLCESIKNLPGYFRARPIILSDRTGVLMIIDGERRSEAAAILEMTLVPTILMHGLTEEQEYEIMMRGNTHNGVWDSVRLQELSKRWKEKAPIWGVPQWERVDESAVDDLFIHTNGTKVKLPKIEITIPENLIVYKEDILDNIKSILSDFPGIIIHEK